MCTCPCASVFMMTIYKCECDVFVCLCVACLVFIVLYVLSYYISPCLYVLYSVWYLCLEHIGVRSRISEVLPTKRTNVQFGSALCFYPSNERSWPCFVRVLLARRKVMVLSFVLVLPMCQKNNLRQFSSLNGGWSVGDF